MKKLFRLIAYALFILLAIGCWLYWPEKQDIHKKGGHAWENYDPSLFYKLQNTDALIHFVDDSIGKENRQTLDYIRLLSRTISYRFYHGYSTYSFHQNWLSYLAGNFVWDHLNAVVLPDDLLKYPNAACSQVSIVLATALKKIGVPYRKVGLKGHFALEANLNGKWYYFDANLEPHFPKGRKSLEELIRNNELYAGYEGHLTQQKFNDVFSAIDYGKPNVALAPNATIFHRVTFPLSILIAFALLLFILNDFLRFFVYKRRGQEKRNKKRRTISEHETVQSPFQQ